MTPGGDFVGRDKNTVNYTFNQQIYQGQEPDAPADKIHIYRQWLVERYGNIPLEVIEQAASDASQSYQQVSIESVYVALDTTTRVSEEALLRALESGQPLIREPDERMNTRDQRALSALAATALHRRLVLLGGPGSGKTTFGNRLVVALAERNWQGMEGWPERLRDCLPVVVTLRFFARWLAGQEHKPSPGLLCSFIREELEDHSLDFVWSLIEQDLNGAERVFLFLDGLDEVPASVRKTLLDTVDAFQKRYTAVRMLITCRIASYEDRSWQLPSNTYAVETLALLDREKIERFVETWYQVMAERWKRSAVEMRDRAAQLRDALFRPGSDLFRLARNPLLLTQMALVHAHNKRLPDHRAKLYDEVVEILVGRWDERRLDGEAELSRHLQAGQCELEMLIDELRRVAWEAHGRMVTQIDVEGDGGADERVADLYESQLREDLAVLHQPKPSFDWSTELIDIMRRRTGLLVEQEPKRFTFPHRTFQEFLAGSYLACEPNFASNALDKVKEGAFWREVVLLAVGYQVHVRKEIDAPLSLVAELCPAAIPADGDESAWQSVRIAGEALLEMGLNRVRLRERGRELLERVQLRLLGLVEKGLLTAKERVRCGDVLGKLGDPRFDPERLFLPRWFHGKPEPRFGFVEIRKGLFVMGSSPEEIEALKQEEHGLPEEILDAEAGNTNPLTMPHDYWIARYSVTVAQYGAFVDAGGYREERWWQTEASRAWLQEGQTCPGGWEGQRLHPNRPVTGVCWFEAMAYCAWLDDQLRGEFPEGYRVRLPSEAEWEKAARGGEKVTYPWGNARIDGERANYDGNIGHPSAVGAYPLGATPTRLFDLVGNVWEWTLSAYADYPYKSEVNIPSGDSSRVLRGGSWDYQRQAARCAYRSDNPPDNRYVSLGFRVVVSLAFDS